MPITVQGVVENGRITPSSPLPEGARVEIRVCEAIEVPPELQEEFDAWDRASAESLALVDRLTKDMEHDEKR